MQHTTQHTTQQAISYNWLIKKPYADCVIDEQMWFIKGAAETLKEMKHLADPDNEEYDLMINELINFYDQLIVRL